VGTRGLKFGKRTADSGKMHDEELGLLRHRKRVKIYLILPKNIKNAVVDSFSQHLRQVVVGKSLLIL
jgi:hypothetical protein